MGLNDNPRPVMIRRKQHDLIRLMTAACLGTFALSIGSVCQPDELPPNHARLQTKGLAFQLKHFQVIQGSEDAARQYYRKIVAAQMKLEAETTIETSTIKSLLTYFGYPGINARDLHQLSSESLMALSSDGDILATRFSAPKISDVKDKPVEIPVGGFGWRKLVRLKAKSGSAADGNGLQAVYILQNIFEASVAGDPFDVDKNVSKFNQAIVVRKNGTGPYNDNKHPAYFLTYGRLVKVDPNNTGNPIRIDGQFQDDGALIFSLKATFDEDDRDPETNSQPKEYFIPDSCVQCHGGVRTRVKLNYLDTDHWFDRVTPAYGLNDAKFSQEDFKALGQSFHGVIYDGGKDTTTSKFKGAFRVIQRLNEEIKEQNADVAGPNNFQLAAVTKWLELHATEAGHIPPFQRGFGTSPVWDPQSDSHKKLIYYLNRYCYRCHSSVRYNVFDRAAVRGRASQIEERVLEINGPDIWMPQDRIFPGLDQTQGVGEATGELKEFLDLLQQLQ
jgi:hypothetical protein